jgi:hypothetical protein
MTGAATSCEVNMPSPNGYCAASCWPLTDGTRHSERLVGLSLINKDCSMKKSQFLDKRETRNFVTWLAGILDSSRRLHFTHKSGVYSHLSDALVCYAWPQKSTVIDTPGGPLSICARSNFEVNEQMLDRLGDGLRGSLYRCGTDDSEVIGWARAIMQWGGVYTRRPKSQGNAGWLDAQKGRFSKYLRQLIETLNSDDETTLENISDLRSNAGTTKIHSLLLTDFVIYDSRVAAALAWLVYSWSRTTSIVIPTYLQFGCMRANTTKPGGKKRKPDDDAFQYFSPTGRLKNHYKHAMWNLRANWIIQAAIQETGGQSINMIWTSRKVEAALFMIGDDLAHAI